MLKEYLIDKKCIDIKYPAADWQSAVRRGCELLERAGAVSDAYYEAILENVRKNGPYFVLIPGFAMPHAAPSAESGVRTVGFSLVTLQNPVSFGHESNDPVDVLIGVCAPNRDEFNEQAMVEVMELIDDEPRMERLRAAEDRNQAFDALAR